MLALPLLAADLRPLKDPARIEAVFPRTAKVRLLNVWATWCVPCVAEMPDLLAIDNAFGGELAMAGVSLDDMIPDTRPDKVRTFLEKAKITFPNVYYTGSADALGERLKFNGEIPITIIYDRNGKELWRHQGRLERDATIAQLRDILRRMR
ncbi:MAG: TlpA disulfide reductase family protein [Acidobacteriota bacterium]